MKRLIVIAWFLGVLFSASYAAAASHLDGVWDSSIGFQYQITKNGNSFTWDVISPINEQGTGTMSGTDVSASWSGANGSGSATGQITEIDSKNRAVEIQWSNGNVFHRDPIINIEGVWEDSNGYEYHITQDMNDFTWDVITPINEQASGTMSGYSLSASWSGDQGLGSATGQITEINSKYMALEIQWSDGEVFYRKPIINIEGVWDSSINFQYQLTQNENSFTWDVISPISEQGIGTMLGSTVSASWSGANGSGSATGLITEIDSMNRAVEIQWSNGVIFYRDPIIDISGEWDSNINFQYQITQDENAFIWDVTSPISEQGTGTASGYSVSASWSGANGSGSATGQITKVDSNYRALEIQWSNGNVFYRQPTITMDGVWNSSINFRYQITQSGNSFTWDVISPINEQGTGTMSGTSVSASWSGNNGSGSATGQITKVDSMNRAVEIRWSNGVVFYRETSITVDGIWNSSINFQYQFTQNGSSFTWDVIYPLNEQGSGTISGTSVSASWSGEHGSGNATGQITQVDSMNRAVEIQWSNGNVFYR